MSASAVSFMYSYYLHQGGYVFAFVCLSVGRISQPAVDEFWIILEGWDVYVRVCVTIQIRDIFDGIFFIMGSAALEEVCVLSVLRVSIFGYILHVCRPVVFLLVLQLRWCVLDSPINQSINQSINRSIDQSNNAFISGANPHNTHRQNRQTENRTHCPHIIHSNYTNRLNRGQMFDIINATIKPLLTHPVLATINKRIKSKGKGKVCHTPLERKRGAHLPA